MFNNYSPILIKKLRIQSIQYEYIKIALSLIVRNGITHLDSRFRGNFSHSLPRFYR